MVAQLVVGRVVVDGAPFGHYRLIELLGRGGMGEVWRAHDTAIDRTVAIKMLLPHFAQDKTFEQRFRREARAAARLDDPHVVPIYDVGEINGRLYVAMRLINGEDLQTLLNDGPLGPDRAIRITEQVASALQAAHKVGLVHRDVKPSNILITEDDFAYLIDFGIARAAGEADKRGARPLLPIEIALSRRTRRVRVPARRWCGWCGHFNSPPIQYPGSNQPPTAHGWGLGSS
jgi:serine/threonine protein kinase